MTGGDRRGAPRPARGRGRHDPLPPAAAARARLRRDAADSARAAEARRDRLPVHALLPAPPRVQGQGPAAPADALPGRAGRSSPRPSACSERVSPCSPSAAAGSIVGLHKASFVVWVGAFGDPRPRLPATAAGPPPSGPGDRRSRPARRNGRPVAPRRRGARGGDVSRSPGPGFTASTESTAKTPRRPAWSHDRAAAHPVLARRAPRTRRAPLSPAARALGLPPVGPGPVPGYVLIADRNANKLLIVSPSKRIVWQFPRPGDLRRGQSFYDPDDAFFTPGYRADRHERGVQRPDRADRPALAPDRLELRPRRRGRLRAQASSPIPTTPTSGENRHDHGRGHQELPRAAHQPAAPDRGRDRRGGCAHDPPRVAGLSERRDAARRTAACSSPRSAAGSTGSTATGGSCSRCGRRPHIPPTHSCSPTATSSSPGSTHPAGST